MKLVWDWRFARVYDENDNVVDECIWGGNRTPDTLADRLASLMKGRMTSEAHPLAERFPDSTPTPPMNVNSWPEVEASETKLLQEASIKLAERGVSESASDPDSRLEHLVQATEEMRSAHNTLESRVVEWVALFLPNLDIDLGRSRITGAI